MTRSGQSSPPVLSATAALVRAAVAAQEEAKAGPLTPMDEALPTSSIFKAQPPDNGRCSDHI